MAVLLQALAIKLGMVTGRDLAQACRDHYRRPCLSPLDLCEIAIAACDLAEVIGSAIALNLLFHIPLLVGVCLTALDVLVILFLQQQGFRFLEALVISLIATIGVCFAFEIFFSRPEIAGRRARLLRPVPANLFATRHALHRRRDPRRNRDAAQSLSAFRHRADPRFRRTPEGKREAIRYGVIDSTVALTFALFINAAILLVAAATFLRHGLTQVAEIQDAYKLLTPMLGVSVPAPSSPSRSLLPARTRRSPERSLAKS